MKRAIRIKMTAADGNACWWTVKNVDATQVRAGHKPRRMKGWSYTDHELYERYSEGNWLALVDAFRFTAQNYGLSTTIS